MADDNNGSYAAVQYGVRREVVHARSSIGAILSIESVHLNVVDMTTIISLLQEQPQLKELCLTRCNVGNVRQSATTAFGMLCDYLEDNEGNSTNISKLKLSQSRLNNIQLKRLVHALVINKSVTCVRFGWQCVAGLESGQLLGDLVIQKENLEKLDIQCGTLGEEGLAALFIKFRDERPNLENLTLRLDGQARRIANIPAIAHGGLQNGPNRTIKMKCIDLSSDGGELSEEAISNLRFLSGYQIESLSFKGCQMRKRGVAVLAESSFTVKKMNLSANMLISDALPSITKLLVKGLQHLKVNSNPGLFANGEMVNIFIDEFKSCTTILTLSTARCGLSEATRKTIDSVLERNNALTTVEALRPYEMSPDRTLPVLLNAVARLGRDHSGHGASLIYRIMRACLPIVLEGMKRKAEPQRVGRHSKKRKAKTQHVRKYCFRRTTILKVPRRTSPRFKKRKAESHSVGI